MKRQEAIQKSQNQNAEERILDESMRLFLERGYHGTSIDDITQAAGLTKGALYWHFKSKEALLKRIIDEYERRFLYGMIHAVEEVKGGALDKFEKYIRFNSAFAYYNRELCVSFATLSAELLGSNGVGERRIRQIYGKYRKFLSDLVLDGKKEKIFRKDLDSNLAALVVMALHDGILLHWSMNRRRIDGEAYVKVFKKILYHGLIKKEGPES